MAVVGNAEKMWSRNAGSIRVSGTVRKDAKFAEAWSVVLDSPTDDVEVVLAAPNLPRICDWYLGKHEYIKCVARNPQQVSPIYWIVGIEYEGEIGPSGASDSPVNREPEILWTDTESDEPIDEDADGNPIVTVNGEPIEGVTTKLADLVLNVKRNYQDFSPALTHQYRHSVNSDTFAGFAAGTARLTKFSARPVWDNACGRYWEVNASIQFRYPWRTTAEKAWYARVRHEGYYVKEPITGAIVRATDDAKEQSTKPVLLDINGYQITNPANAIWLEWKRYQPLPYNSLGLL